jgi:hypothetical protein
MGHGQRAILRAFIAFIRHGANEDNPMGDNWNEITRDEFSTYRVGPSFNGTIFGSPSPSNPGTPAASSTTHACDAVADFKRGIKRDPSQFPILKDDKQWDGWNRSHIAQARAQGVVDVMNSEYKPTTTEDKEALFEVKQTYMFAVFEMTLLTDQGKAYVREYEKKFDAQSIYPRISEYAIKSTKASLETSTILSYITSCKLLGEGSAWRGPTSSFVLHWQNQVRLYETQAESEEYFSNGQKRHMLQNAVHPVQELRAVKTQADQHKPQTEKELTYDQYVNLLLSAASAYDAQFAPKTHSAARAPCRDVYSQDITESSGLMATILPTISTAHSASSSQSRLTLLHELLLVLCTLTISKNRTMTTILPTIPPTAHSTSSRLMAVRLAPAAWHFPSGDTVLVSGCERHLGQASRRGKRHSRTRERQDVGLTKILETGT